MKVLHITNNYPTLKFPIFGIFVKEQIDSLTKQGVENEVFFINGKENGKKEYLQAICKIRKIIKKQQFDIIHCHHLFSAIILLLSFRCFNNKYPNIDFIRPIIIGNNVFIGSNVTIMRGVTIGNNVIIGASSVITKDIPNDVVVVGIPGRIIKTIDEYEKKIMPQTITLQKKYNQKAKKEELLRLYN
jgi:hypothetical protein